MMRAPYEIGEEIRGKLLKILQTKHNKMGRKSAPMLTSYTETGSVLIPPFLNFLLSKISQKCSKNNEQKYLNNIPKTTKSWNISEYVCYKANQKKYNTNHCLSKSQCVFVH